MNAEEKWARIRLGERVVCSDVEMEIIESQEGSERLVSLPNRSGVGILDRWVAFLRTEGRGA